MLIGRVFVLVGAFPARAIPNFETTSAADQGDLAFQLELLAKFIRQHETTLLVGDAMLGAGMKLALENAGVARRKSGRVHRGGSEAREFLRRHDEEALQILLRQEDEFFRLASAPPAGRDCHAVLPVDLMTEITGVEMR